LLLLNTDHSLLGFSAIDDLKAWSIYVQATDHLANFLLAIISTAHKFISWTIQTGHYLKCKFLHYAPSSQTL
jgi:hypothetical protein